MTDALLRFEERLVLALRELYGSYGYRPFRMSCFEEYDLYVSNKPFLLSDKVITFTDADGRLLALPPDVTLSIVKSCRPQAGEVIKVYYDENVFRVGGGSEEFREIRQAGLECIGALDAAALGEVVSLAAASLAAVSDRYVLDVSHLGVASSVIDALGVPDDRRPALLSALGGKNPHGILSVLSEVGIGEEAAAPLLALVRLSGAPSDVLPELYRLLSGNAAAISALDELAAVGGAAADPQVRIDFSVTHDMRYYNGIVFRGFVPGVASAVLSGGQYDRLVTRLGGVGGACGFAVYLDRLAAGAAPAAPAACDVFLVYEEADAPARVLAAAAALRRSGKSVRIGRRAPEGMTVLTLSEVEI